jgi:selenophosphate synthetase-related protein
LSRLEKLINLLLNFDGISRKFVLPTIIRRLRTDSFNKGHSDSLGEDSAAISTDSDDYVLLTTDSIVEELCLNHPRAAGFNVVLANVMDIYAAGGIPTSFAIALSYSDPKIGEELFEGLIDGSHMFQVPIVRGHTNPSAQSTYVVGSATGTIPKAHLLTAGGALQGDVIVLVYDEVGRRGTAYTLGWDTVTDRESSDTVKRLSVMNKLARAKIVHASKDVSVAGLVGTAGMMLEYSGRGGVLDLDIVNDTKPDRIPLEDWLRMYISLGFLLAIAAEDLERVSQVAQEHGMSVIKVGIVDDSASLRLKLEGEESTIFDFSKGPLLTPKSKPRQ